MVGARSAVGVAVLTVLAAVAFIAAAIMQGDTATTLLGRDEARREAVGLPDAKWGGAGNQEGLTDNFGATNMKISNIIDDLNTFKSHPNFAAAVHSLKAATSRSTSDFHQFQSDLHVIPSEKFLPAMPDPEAIVGRMQGLRKTSRYCRLNPTACKTLAPEWVAAHAESAPLEDEKEENEEKEEGTAEPEAAKGQLQLLAFSTAGRTFAGRGDSLLPHGPLWGLHDKHTVRYHEYPGFYQGSQADRAATESAEQAASEAYGLESKQLAQAWNNMGKGLKRIRQRIASKGFSKDYREGGALLALGGSKVGKVLPRLAKLERDGGRKGVTARQKGAKLPQMKGVSMSLVGLERPGMALDEEELYQGRQQQLFSQWAAKLPQSA